MSFQDSRGGRGWGELREPQLQTLVPRVSGQQPVDRGGAGAGGQAGDEDRSFDRDIDVLRILLEGRFGNQPGHQRISHEEAVHLAAELGQVRVVAERLEQHAQRFFVVVIVDAEVIHAAGFDGRGLQALDGKEI